jgi:hypothetical protein
MKKLNILLTLALIATMILTSCGGEDDPKNEMVLNGTTVSLENANFYLAYIGTYYTGLARNEGAPSHVYHDIVITDGTLNNSYTYAHWESANYTDATYIIVLELLMPANAEFEGGVFPQRTTWGTVASTAQVSWIQAEILGDNYEYVYTETDNGDDIIVNGGWDDSENMTIKMNADDLYDYELDASGATLKIFFSGILDENRYNPQ